MRSLTLFAVLGICTVSFAAEPVVAPGGTRIPSAQALAEAVPTTGKLSERALILMAIARRTELDRLRGAVAVAIAQHRAAGDLVNPELRFSYAQDNDDRIGEPYTERETISTNSLETFDSTRNTSSLLTNGGITSAESATRIERGTVEGNRFRQIERRVTPGATTDVVEERVYETNSNTSTSTRNGTQLDNKGLTNSTDQLSGTDNRKLIGTTRREIQHPDASGRDNAWGVMLRFNLPHPWERRARIQRAAAEVSLAEAEYYAGEDIVVRTVRATFQELAILQAKLVAQQSRKANFEAYRNWLDEQKTLQLGLDLAAARAKVYGTVADIRALESDLAGTREHLAAYCGLADASRIEPAMMSRHISSPSTLDIDYLTDLAMLYRSDVLSTQARLAVAHAQLAEAKAARIPFTTFIDFGLNQTNTLRRTGQNEEWFARVGISIPLWEWTGFNKKRKVPEAASQSLQQQLTMHRSLIGVEIAQAVKRLVAVDQQLSSADKDLADLKADQKKAIEETHMATADVNDLVKGKRIEYEFQDLATQMEVSRLSHVAAYHEVLMELEKSLGIRLERALNLGGTPEAAKAKATGLR